MAGVDFSSSLFPGKDNFACKKCLSETFFNLGLETGYGAFLLSPESFKWFPLSHQSLLSLQLLFKSGNWRVSDKASRLRLHAFVQLVVCSCYWVTNERQVPDGSNGSERPLRMVSA